MALGQAVKGDNPQIRRFLQIVPFPVTGEVGRGEQEKQAGL